jgi:HAD superfamily hydrolase (TIGR01490 family)
MTKPFAVFDIDGTLIRWQLFHAVVDRLAKAGHVPADAYEKAHDARMLWKRRTNESSFREYEQKLVDAYVGSLSSLRVADFQKAADAVVAEHKDQVYTFTRDLIRELKAKGYLLFAISASQSEIVGMLTAYYGFDDYAASVYEQKDGYFTGNVDVIARKKPELLEKLIAKHGVTKQGSFGVGDTESDISMLEVVEHPIAFNPSKKLFQHAQSAGWNVVVERKNMIYKLEPHDGTYQLAETDV